MSNEIESAADAIRRTLSEKVSAVKNDPVIVEVIKNLTALNALESLLGLPKTTLSGLFDLGGELSTTATTASVAIAPDEFVHIAPLEAAKRYLRKVQKPARPFTEIVKAIKAGGADVRDEGALKNQLVKSTSQIKQIGDLYGLLEWYPKKRGRPVGGGGSGNGEANAEDHADEVETDADDEAATAEHDEGAGEG
jgi:hypothetical protein